MPARRLLFSLTIAKKTIRSTSSSNTESESESSESESLDCSIKVCPAGGCFSKFRMLALTAATTNSISTTWRTEVSNASLVQWFKVIKVSIPSDVLTTFDTAVRPSFDALRKLPFYPDENGVYLDTLKTPSGNIYIQAAPLIKSPKLEQLSMIPQAHLCKTHSLHTTASSIAQPRHAKANS
jgi:hypothetical protein